MSYVASGFVFYVLCLVSCVRLETVTESASKLKYAVTRDYCTVKRQDVSNEGHSGVVSWKVGASCLRAYAG